MIFKAQSPIAVCVCVCSYIHQSEWMNKQTNKHKQEIERQFGFDEIVFAFFANALSVCLMKRKCCFLRVFLRRTQAGMLPCCFFVYLFI